MWIKKFGMRNGLVKNNNYTHLRSKDIEVPSPVSTADELAFVLGRDAGIFGNPHHRGTQSVGVQV